ncbi:MAG: hypothetical protein J3R72DRAFT_445223 [Linnemannia gamsii]|nr:MAG: hypothetical protein J3R72DRAFT_445223 [Linnemannia gamsii]
MMLSKLIYIVRNYMWTTFVFLISLSYYNSLHSKMQEWFTICFLLSVLSVTLDTLTDKNH